METFLWVEKYRPKTVDDCILPSELKKSFSEFVKDKHIPNLILSGSAGTGKTTIAKAMVEEIGSTWMLINGSEESGIDVLRTKIKNFASTVSLEGGRKYIILDEADYLNPQSTQPALRGFMEEFHKNCGFILTCNYKNRLIEPLQSRCSNIDFTIRNGERVKLAESFFKRVQDILGQEQIKFEPKAIAELINKYFPDWRRCLNELQRYSTSGQIDAGILVNLSSENIKVLVSFMKAKEFRFFIPKDQPNPEGNIEPNSPGKRDVSTTTLRGQISGGDGKARITAPLFWYNKYLNGGGLQKSVEAGAKFAFKRNPQGK